MTDPTVRGRFVWHELLTSDPQAAQQFYTRICGWQVQSWDKDPNYAMFVGPKGPLGGIVKLPEGAMGTGHAPKWLPYIAVDDVDATVAKAQSLGGRVLEATGATPGGGRYAVLADPQGACFGVYASAADAPPGAEGLNRGEFSWHELSTTDHEAAFRFYSELFGWDDVVQHDMGPMGMYRIFGRGAEQFGGMFNKTTDMPGEPAWLSYVLVQNARKSAGNIESAGGRVTNGPMEVPGGDWITTAIDPQGAPFAVHAYKSKAKAHAAAQAGQAEVPKREEVAKPQKRAKAAVSEAAASASEPSAEAGKVKAAVKKLLAESPAPKSKPPMKAAKKAKKAAKKKAASRTSAKSAKTTAKKTTAKKTKSASRKGKPARTARKSATKSRSRPAKKVAKKSAQKSSRKTAKKKTARKGK